MPACHAGGLIVVDPSTKVGDVTADDELTRHYDRHDDLVTGVLRALADAGHDLDALEPTALSGADEFHLGGRLATEELLDGLGEDPPRTILDVGCGIGGPARTMATTLGAEVVGVDLTPSFISAATELSVRVGLADRVTFRVGDALDLDVADESFDLATLFHVGMNIADKPQLFSELARVLRPGGQVLVYDIMRIAPGELVLPLPWTSTAEYQHVAPASAYLEAMGSAGLHTSEPIDHRPLVAEALRQAEANPPAVTLSHLMGADFGQMFANLRSAIGSGVLAPMHITATKP